MTIEGERKTVAGGVRRHQGLDRADGRPRPRGRARNHRLRIEARDNAVQHYDGCVVQSTSDGIFALFGAPAANR